MKTIDFMSRVFWFVEHRLLLSLSAGYRRANRIDGLLAIREQLALRRIALRLPASSTCVEIGVYRGRSSYLLQDAFRGKRIRHIVVDTFCTGVGGCESEPRRQEFERNLAKHLYNIEIWEMDSLGLSSRLGQEDVLVDLALIDGDHSYPMVVNDTRAILEHASRGATICFRDFLHPCGVTTAVGEQIDAGTLQFERLVGSLLIARAADLES